MYLNEFSRLQYTIENNNHDNNFILNEESEIKDYAAIYTSHNEASYKLTNDKNFKEGKIIIELHFHNTIYQKGWDKLSITTHKPANAFVQSYLAGYLEGRATAMEIFHFYNNLRLNTKQKHQFKKMKKFFLEVVMYLQKRIKNIKTVKDIDAKKWSRLLLGYVQLEGLIKGYTYEMKKQNKYSDVQYQLDLADFLIIQADGEVPELLRFFRSFDVKTKIGEKNYFKDAFGIDTEDPKEFWSQLMSNSRCSAFIKLTKDQNGKWDDLLIGHTTWTDFSEMLRIYKHYKFEFENNEDLPSSEMTFSSYPGCLTSTDDFFITNNNLVITETTLEIIDIYQYRYVKPADIYIPNFMRVLSASRFAKSAKEWCKIFAFMNSGTYSSQWMILDYNIFKQVKGTKKNLSNMVYMMEQSPQRIVYHDISNYIEKQSYFGSYNRAFLAQTRETLDSALIRNLYGKTFSYRNSARRKIINHFASKVRDLKSLKDLLRYNGFNKQNFTGDPSNYNPAKGISARNDLVLWRPKSGGIDTKVTNAEFVFKMTSVAISGPTTENNHNLSIFDWKMADPNNYIKREGVPERFDFPYILMNPKTICCDNNNDVYKF